MENSGSQGESAVPRNRRSVGVWGKRLLGMLEVGGKGMSLKVEVQSRKPHL